MKISLSILTIAVVIMASSVSLAQTRRYSPSGTTSTSSRNMAISGALGFYAPGGAVYTGKIGGTDSVQSPNVSGLFGIGADFDYWINSDFSVGGLFRYYSTSDTAGASEFTNRLLTIGATAKAYLIDTNSWDGYFTTGLGIISPSWKQTSGTVTQELDVSMGFGFYFGMGVLYKINPTLGVGVENLRMVAVGEKINGWPLSDYMFKVRFAL